MFVKSWKDVDVDVETVMALFMPFPWLINTSGQGGILSFFCMIAGREVLLQSTAVALT